MDTKPIADIRLYATCDELPMWNFEKIRKGESYKWLVYGYEGWGEAEEPENGAQIWSNLLDEYAKLTKNNEAMQYFQLLSDESDLETRLTMGAMLLKNMKERWHIMTPHIQKGYVEQLAVHRFYLNTGKPFDEELERLFRQLRAVETKLKQLTSEKKAYEAKRPDSDIIEQKVAIQRIIKMPIDLKKTSVKEWLLIVQDAMNSVKPAKNGTKSI